MRDDVIFAVALEADEVVVSINADDYAALAEQAEVHAGVIVLREGELRVSEQWRFLEAALDALSGRDELINTLVDVYSPEDVRVSRVPPADE